MPLSSPVRDAPHGWTGEGHDSGPDPAPVLPGEPRIAIVHDYLNQHGGAERVLEELHCLWPAAPVFTSMYDRERMPSEYRSWDIRTTWMRRLPRIHRYHQPYLPLYPLAFARLDLSGYDLVISSSSAFAKNVHPARGALHICYCHSPMRFAWTFDDYARRERLGRGASLVLRPLLRSVRLWDAAGSARVTHFVANSNAVAARIQSWYGRDAVVIHPPVRAERAPATSQATADPPYFLVVTRLVPYKRLDIVVDAFTTLGLPLYVAGAGRDRPALEARAGRNVRFLGTVTEAEKQRLYAGCRATVFPAEDDFGIAQVEAQAAGRPTIAFAAGGALETIEDGVSGVFFHEQSPAAVIDAVRRFETLQFDAERIAARARAFDDGVFRARFAEFVGGKWAGHFAGKARAVQR